MKTVLVVLFSLLALVSAQEPCDGVSVYYLNSFNFSASTLANKPLVITGNNGIVVNVKFVVLDAPVTSNVQVTVLGQGTTITSASSIGSQVSTSDGLSITISSVDGIKTSAASSPANSLVLILPALFLAFFFGKRSIFFLVVLSFALLVAHAADPCAEGQAGATVIISIPDQFAFSTTTFNTNGGSLACDADVGLIAPVCNAISYNAMLPDTLGPYNPTTGFTVQWVAGGIYAVWDGIGIYNAMFVVTTEGVIVIDAPPTLGEAQKAAIASITDQPVKYFIYSHFHTDHVGSSNNWANTPGLLVIGHQAVYDAIALSNSPVGASRLLPNITFTNGYNLTLGNETLELFNLGVFHSVGDTFIYSRVNRVMLAVDLFSKSFAPFRNLFETIYVQGFIHAHDVILSYDWTVLVGGHINLVSRPDVERSRTLVNAIRTAAINSLFSSQGFPNTGVDKNGNSNPWLTFNVFLDSVVNGCVDNFRTSNAEFFTQYSGLDVFIFSYCDNMVRAIRLE